MAKGDNPYDPEDEGTYVPPGLLPQRPSYMPAQAPISGTGDPFNPPTGTDYPPPATALSNAADFSKAASNTFSMGMRDRLGGAYRYFTGQAPSYSAGVEQEVADSLARRERSPFLSVAGDVAGGTAQAYVPGAGAVGRGVSAALGGAGRGVLPSVARMAGYGVEGGLLGAGQAAGNTYTGNPIDYAHNALVGGALGAALGAPFGHYADVAPRSAAVIPNSAVLQQSAKDSYLATHNVPIAYDANHYWSGLDALERNLLTGTANTQATNRVRSPTVFEALNLAREDRALAQQAGVTGVTVNPEQIDAIRQQLTGVKEPGAYAVRNWLDQYMASPAGQVAGTDAHRAEIVRLLNNARGDNRAASNTRTIEKVNQYAADRARVANSSQNIANTYGQKLTGLLAPDSSKGRWFSPEQQADIRRTAGKDTLAQYANIGGNMLGGGLGAYAGMLGAGGIGAAFTTGDLRGLSALGAPVVGYALKNYANRSMVNQANALADRMAMNSPLYRERAANAPTVPGPGLSNAGEATRNALTLGLLEQLRLRGGLPSYSTEGD